MADSLSHLDNQGKAKMVDVSKKDITDRKAIAVGEVKMKAYTLSLIKKGGIKKGAVLETARIAGIMAVKKTSDLIPMCHPLFISAIDIEFKIISNNTIKIKVAVRNNGKTGVEMEALTGVSIAALTIYDMCKAVDRSIIIGDIKLIYKDGGKSGRYERLSKADNKSDKSWEDKGELK